MKSSVSCRHLVRRTVVSTAWLLPWLVLSSCTEAASTPKSAQSKTLSPKPERVRLQLNWVPEPEFGGIYAAQVDGFFAKEGLEVEILKGAAGVPSPQLTSEGQVEFGIVGGDQVVVLRSRGAPLTAVYACFQTFPRGFIVHDASPVRTLQDLWKEGVTVAVEPGLPFVKWMNRTFAPSKPTLVASQGSLTAFLQTPALAQAAFVFSEPAELALRKVPVRTLPVADSGYDPYSVVVATSDAFLRKRPDTVRRLIRALRAGWTAYLADPSKVNAVMAKLNPGMSREAMDRAASLADPFVRGQGGPLGAMTEARWKTLGEQLVAVGAIEHAPKATSLFRNFD